jgi:hypothetical protein
MITEEQMTVKEKLLAMLEEAERVTSIAAINEEQFPLAVKVRVCGALLTHALNVKIGFMGKVRFYCGDEVNCAYCCRRKAEEMVRAMAQNILAEAKRVATEGGKPELRLARNVPMGTETETLLKRAGRNEVSHAQFAGETEDTSDVCFLSDGNKLEKHALGEESLDFSDIDLESDDALGEIQNRLTEWQDWKEIASRNHKRGKRFTGGLAKREVKATSGPDEEKEETHRIGYRKYHISIADSEKLDELLVDFGPTEEVTTPKEHQKAVDRMQKRFEAIMKGAEISAYTEEAFINVAWNDVEKGWNRNVRIFSLSQKDNNSPKMDIADSPRLAENSENYSH